MTRGIESPAAYYYRRVYTDAVLAVDAARMLPGPAVTRILVAGVSQGGGIALAVGALATDVAAVLADVPFLSDFPRAVAVATAGPYLELAALFASDRRRIDAAFHTLSYFDAALLVPSSTAPALFSVALADTFCPPSTVFASYNAYGGPKDICVYPYNDHEGGLFQQEAEQLGWLASLAEAPAAARATPQRVPAN